MAPYSACSAGDSTAPADEPMSGSWRRSCACSDGACRAVPRANARARASGAAARVGRMRWAAMVPERWVRGWAKAARRARSGVNAWLIDTWRWKSVVRDPILDRVPSPRFSSGAGLERRRIPHHPLYLGQLRLLRGGEELPQEPRPGVEGSADRPRPGRARAHGRACAPDQRAADLHRRDPRRRLRRHDGAAPRRRPGAAARAARPQGRRGMSAGGDGGKDRVAEFTAFRQRMNERILAEPNQVVRRFFALDTQAY